MRGVHAVVQRWASAAVALQPGKRAAQGRILAADGGCRTTEVGESGT